MVHDNYTWGSMGMLDSPTSIENGGVYLLVFTGKPKRVIYVGTTNSFNRRINEHRNGMLQGKRTVWRVAEGKDIYELISHKDEGNPYKYYHSLANKGKLWATTAVDKSSVSNDLLKRDSFEVNWKEYVHDFYIKNIEVWILRNDFSGETNRRIESQIQIALKDRYSIGSHIHNTGMCWLGKIEYTEDVFSTSYTFTNAPDISEEFQEMLYHLGGKSLAKYRKPYKVQADVERAASIKAARENYKYAKTAWERKEDELLCTCVALSLPIREITNHLQRTPEEIINRISYLRKFYKF